MKKNIRRNDYTNYIKIGIVLILVLWIFSTVIYNTVTNYRLLNNGIKTSAVVYEKKYVGSKGTLLTKYYFIWNGKKYYGESTSDDSIAVGDSLLVYFFENDPTVNKSKSVVE